MQKIIPEYNVKYLNGTDFCGTLFWHKEDFQSRIKALNKLINLYTKKMNKDKFDFGEALAYIKAGFVVSLTLNKVERRYYLNQFNNIVCVPNGKEHLAYIISEFKIDAVMSNDWILIN